MKKIFFFLLFLIVIVGLCYFIFKDKVGDFRPAFLPPTENLASKIQDSQMTGEHPDIPLTLPDGYAIGVYQDGLTNVRDLQISPGGILLASLMNKGEIVALPDKNNDGRADGIYTVIKNLQRPHGIAFYNGKLFVAEENKVIRYSYNEATFEAVLDKKLFDLPSGGRHFSRSITFDKEGKMYVSLGSTCDVCVEKNSFIATVIVSDQNGTTPRVFSKGLRNAVFVTTHPDSGNIWTTEMGRDFLGDTTPPDEINILDDTADFGWPYCYGDQIWDKSFGQQDQAYCNTTIKPFYKIPAHAAPLGLTFIRSQQMPDAWQGDLLVAYHGSWNSTVPVGYKIVRITTKGTPQESDFITGFLSGTEALGRPVDLEFDKAGSLFISDDKANAIYKLVKKP